MSDTGGPAFPGEEIRRYGNHQTGGTDETKEHRPGMTLLDWFAGQALVGELASQSETVGEYPTSSYPSLAENCYDIAAAMLAEKRRREQ